MPTTATVTRATEASKTFPHVPSRNRVRRAPFGTLTSHGFSTLGLSDHQILEQEFIVYNALYAECNKRVAA